MCVSVCLCVCVCVGVCVCVCVCVYDSAVMALSEPQEDRHMYIGYHYYIIISTIVCYLSLYVIISTLVCYLSLFYYLKYYCMLSITIILS